MRLTINLDDDLYAMARSHATATRMSLSKAVADLLRRRMGGVSEAASEKESASYFDPLLGIKVSRSGRALSHEELNRALAEDDLSGSAHVDRSAPHKSDR